MNKRGEKELQMIFGLFILLIITLVVLNLFLQASKKGIGQVEKSSTAELKSQEISRLKLNCQALCDQINDVNTAIEFCANYQTLDSDTSNTKIPEKARFGRFLFCKTKVPCFIVIDNCQNGLYTIDSCKNLLLSDQSTYDLYNKMVQDVGQVAVGSISASDGCNLPDQIANPSIDPNELASNWKYRGDYLCDAATAEAAGPPNYDCP